MRKRHRLRRAFSTTLSVLILVSMNINPLAVIAGAIADSGMVDRFVNLKNNLVYMASNNWTVNAAESEDSTTIDFECDATEAIDALMGDGDVTLTDLQNSLEESVILIKGAIEEGDASIVSAVGNVDKTLQGISSQLANLQSTIEQMQHAYRVAHLYSINNEDRGSLWRPYTDDVPYVKDFASVAGQFANVYTGYWDSAVTTLTNPGGSAASRALNVLGYDAIVRYEGVVLQKTVGTRNTPKGLSMYNTTYDQLENKQSAYTIATVEREEIGIDEITWLDAVTLLYKALGQEQYTYQSFMSENWGITPETSPAYQGLSNIVPTTDANGTTHYNGYDFRMFITRSNIIYGTSGPETAKKEPLYWTKAVTDQFIPSRVTMDDTILGSDFLKLAYMMMVAYGEPEMTMDETMALLQVYGTNFPISLGIDVADAWAYVKVRGCLADDVLRNLSRPVSRDELLDVCMRIKDRDSRLDYKNIDIVLDIGELLRDDGYYPVYDLDFSIGSFSTSIEYDYALMSDYGYCVLMPSNAKLGHGGVLQVLSETDVTKKIAGAYVVSQNMEVDGFQAVLFTVPKSYRGNIYIANVDLTTGSVVSGDVAFIEIPSALLGGGIFFGSMQMNGTIATVTGSCYHSFDYLSADRRFIQYADFERAKENRPGSVSAASNATVLERLYCAWDSLTSPMVVEAAPDDDSQGSTTVNYTSMESRQSTGSFKYIDEISPHDGVLVLRNVPDGLRVDNLTNNPQSSDNGIYVAANAKTAYMNRLMLVQAYSYFKNAMKDPSNGAYPSNTLDPMSVLREYFIGGADSPTFTQYQSNVMTMIMSAPSAKHTATDENRYAYQGYDDLLIQWLLAVAPRDSRFNYDSSITGSPVTYNDDLLAFRSDYSNGNGYSAELVQWLRNQMSDKTHKQISNDILTAYATAGLIYVTYNANTNTYTFGFSDNSKAGIVMDILGAYEESDSLSATSGSSEFVDIQRRVATSAVMSRNEEKLLSWTALKEAGVVQAMTGDRYPSPNKDGSYFFMTREGQVKVNPLLGTIQIGTTLYDLLPANGGKGPKLIYIDNDQKEMYIDVRCVMGVISQDFVRNDTKTTELKNSIGSGDFVVYDLGADGVKSSLFTSYEINCYNFPDIQGSIFSDSSIGSGYYAVKVFGSTVYDNQYEISNGVNYWGDAQSADYTRIGLSSFVPTANWVTVIDDDGEDIRASLFVYYPKEPFEHGFVDELNGDVIPVPEPKDIHRFDSYLSDVQNTGSTELLNVLNSLYQESERDNWWIKMTYSAAASLYSMTKKYYLSSNYVIREFKLTDNVYNFVQAWDEYADVTETVSSGSNTISTYKEQGNADGAVYWLDGIGFIYNTPSVEDFSLSRYLSGELPLPIATDVSGVYKRPSLINYNMNYWGFYTLADGTPVDDVSYGYTLSAKGYIHYKAITESDVWVKSTYLPKRSNTDDAALPFRLPGTAGAGDRVLTLAPCGIYFYFGGNTLENAPAGTVTKTLTHMNQFYYGTNRVTLDSPDVNGIAKFNIVSDIYNPIAFEANATFYRVYRNGAYDILINNGSVEYGATNGVSEIIIDDYVTELIENPLDRLGATNLIKAIDEGSSLAIVIAFTVLPMIGIFLMMLLVGLSFWSDTKFVQTLCDKTIDPVRLLTLGHRNIHTWTWRRVLVPCTLLFCAFALFLNGNIIRLIQWLAEWYGVISKYTKNML